MSISQSNLFSGSQQLASGVVLPPLGQQLLYIKYNVGGLFLDAFLKVVHTLNLTVTQHPVETGANISDHAYIEPAQLQISFLMSDCATSIIPGQFGDWSSRSVSAFQALRQIQLQRVPVQITTRLNVYQNMLITSLLPTEDNTTCHGLRGTCTLQEIFVATVQTVQIKVSANPQTTDSNTVGTVTPQAPTPAQAAQIESWLVQGEKLLGK